MQRYSSSSHSQYQEDRPSASFAQDEFPNRFKAPPVQLTTWTHEAKNCTSEVVIDLKLLPPGTKEGDVAELRTLGQSNQRKVLFVVEKPTEEFSRTVPNLQVIY